ncbi:leukocyte elastase inhibitor-like [Corythoichthys intestinalis]|uniref:leukocyte elastase inhibitor-like n=1 Tax=Corythoichthys intestinalis TaxID=161448 RepID=UPI0025A67875|nr:leukocyte elastase inhibitor-like [Corythoichthys intestinalis]XP_057679956.1 leukocyte elastase inhibitor-like [Corythoichthys intestinalis]XP_061810316.1 leukocyte elastase inhibitor-like [Nerophis lumbriciformis]
MESKNPQTEANVNFFLALFKKLSEEDKTSNIFFSPFSISSALAMVMLGARGNTATQMSQALCFTTAKQPTEEKPKPVMTQSPLQMKLQMKPREETRPQLKQTCMLPQYLKQVLKRVDGEDDVHADFQKLLIEFNKTNTGYALSIANRLYGEQTYTFVKDFLADTRKYYQAELESVDFKKNAEMARININSWVEEKTQGKIKNLIKNKLIEETKLVLVNAIYFKGKWKQEFDKGLTVEAPFRMNKNDTKQVKMMHQKGEFNLFSIPEVNIQILEMPYDGNDLSMLIFLPNEIEDNTTGLEKLQRELTYMKIKEWTSSDKKLYEVQVSLPQFKMEVAYDLENVLISMGMVDAFDGEKSDFSGMSAQNDLALSKVIHKAFVEVNEEGTEAAGATAAIVVRITSVREPEDPKIFIADHPFFFFIRYNPSNTILFAGQYTSPE